MRLCRYCGKEFTPTTGWTGFCSKECETIYKGLWNTKKTDEGWTRPLTVRHIMMIEEASREGLSAFEIGQLYNRPMEAVLYG